MFLFPPVRVTPILNGHGGKEFEGIAKTHGLAKTNTKRRSRLCLSGLISVCLRPRFRKMQLKGIQVVSPPFQQAALTPEACEIITKKQTGRL